MDYACILSSEELEVKYEYLKLFSTFHVKELSRDEMLKEIVSEAAGKFGYIVTTYRLEHEGKVTMNNSAPRAKPEVHYYS